MKGKVKSLGQTVEVKPNFFNGKIISWTHTTETGDRIYLTTDVEVDEADLEQAILEEKKRSVEEVPSKMNSDFDVFVNWTDVYIRSAYHALSACIVAGKKDAAKSAVYHAKQLVEELKKENITL